MLTGWRAITAKLALVGAAFTPLMVGCGRPEAPAPDLVEPPVASRVLDKDAVELGTAARGPAITLFDEDKFDRVDRAPNDKNGGDYVNPGITARAGAGQDGGADRFEGGQRRAEGRPDVLLRRGR